MTLTAYTHGTLYTGDDIIIDGVTLNSISGDGCRWIVTDLDGWWGLPDTDVPDDTRPWYEEGSYYAIGRYETRNITLSGYIVPGQDNPSGIPFTVAARNALNRALQAVRNTAVLEVRESDEPKFARVQVVGRPLTRFNQMNDALEFNFQLRAADPRKYALAESTVIIEAPSTVGGRNYDRKYLWSYLTAPDNAVSVVNNSGSYPMYAKLTFTGPVLNPVIEKVATGEFFGLSYLVDKDEVVTVDLEKRTVQSSIGQSLKSSVMRGSSWMSFEPGDTEVRFRGIQTIPARVATQEATNMFLNPSAEKASTSVATLFTNLIYNPYGVDTTSWHSNSNGVHSSFDAEELDPVGLSTLITQVAAGTVFVGCRGQIAANSPYTVKVLFWAPLHTNNVQVYLRPSITATTNQVLLGNVNIPAGFSSYVFTGTSSTATHGADAGVSISTSGLSVGGQIAMVIGAVAGTVNDFPMFDGTRNRNWRETASNVAWTGTPLASTSVLRQNRIDGFAGNSAFPLTSLTWSNTGDYSALIVPTSTTSSSSYITPDDPGSGLRNGMEPGKTYTVLATLYNFEEQTGTQNSRARSIVVTTGSDVVGTTSSPNEPGIYQHRLTFSVPSDATTARIYFYHGGMQGSGKLFWDDMMLVEGSYDGDYFDGESMSAVWNGLPHASTSTRVPLDDIPKAMVLLSYRSTWIE